MKTFLAKAVLPRSISDFETNYVARINRIAFWFFAAHLPAFVAIAYFNDTGVADAVALTTLVMLGPVVATRVLTNPRTLAMIYGFTSMLMGGLLVHFGQGPVQIEMHFYFFAQLAMLAVYGNPMVIVVAAVTVAVHHLVVWLYLPASVFNYDAPFWVVLVHAAFVVLESVATCSIARSFFDNVIGLERIVQARTASLRLVLDNVDQGFLTIDTDGVMSSERSAAIDKWLGQPEPEMTLADYLGKHVPWAKDALEMGLSQVRDDLLPVELTLEQLPQELEIDDRLFRITYTPINAGGELERLLVVISDVTAVVERERLEAEQKEVVKLFERVTRDKSGFLEFFEEAHALVENIVDEQTTSLAELKRLVHTLKGNAMLFGIRSVADFCHDLEQRIDETPSLPTSQERDELNLRWQRLCRNLEMFLGKRANETVEVEQAEFEGVLLALLGNTPGEEVARRISTWRLEPTEKRLRRVAEQARGIARRLNKGDLKIVVNHCNSRLEPARWVSFWSAFVHVIRNAVDHGIESPADREAAGKSVNGELRISTRSTSKHFSIEIQDDGRGIDWDQVAAKAAEKGLPARNRADLVEALFTDGLTTTDHVTQFSGRGVGMGALRAASASRNGTIDVQSEIGSGTRILFTFPIEEMAEDLNTWHARQAA